MFEDVTFPYTFKEGKSRKLDRVIQRHIEHQQYQELCNMKTLSKRHRKVLRSPANKKRILHLIRKEMEMRPKPEETYEIWWEQPHINENLKHSKPELHGEALANYLVDHIEKGEVEQDEDETYEEHEASESWHKYTQTFDSSGGWVKDNFTVRSHGLDVKPLESYEPPEFFPRYHVNNLKTLLHLSVLRRNWDVAYKTFCILIRIRMVDLRSIWPLGIEIVKQQRATEPAKITVYKDDKFFEWLSSFYVITNLNAAFNKGYARQLAAPIWRSGSKMRAPIYSISALWSLMVRGEHTKLKEKLEELLLVPPFNNEGVCYFLMGLCYLIESVETAKRYGRHEMDSVVRSLKAIRSNWERSEQLGFRYPKEYLQQQVNEALEMVESSEKINLGNVNKEDDDDEDEDEDDSSDSDNNKTRYKTASPAEHLDQGYMSPDSAGSPRSPISFDSPKSDFEKRENNNNSMDFDFDFE